MTIKYYAYHKLINGVDDYYSIVLAVSYADAKQWTKAKNLYALKIDGQYFEFCGDKSGGVYKKIFELAKSGEREFFLDSENGLILFGKERKVLAREDITTMCYVLVDSEVS